MEIQTGETEVLPKFYGAMFMYYGEDSSVGVALCVSRCTILFRSNNTGL